MTHFLNSQMNHSMKQVTKYHSRNRTFAPADNDYRLANDSITPDLPKEEYELRTYVQGIYILRNESNATLFFKLQQESMSKKLKGMIWEDRKKIRRILL
ncbi:hypothetical protein RN001_001128 [Aquatica leii]|uniref:Uncharacterized protein n=1 Tax=Aquatica leii TaxID=1421715 RepID=A0AAN7Q7N8_9COLE|nr:hypothetical protein RN001_001128 [Aquatica leii]